MPTGIVMPSERIVEKMLMKIVFFIGSTMTSTASFLKNWE